MEQSLAPLPVRAPQGDADQRDGAPNRALAALRQLGAARLAVLGVTALSLLGFFAYLVLQVVEPEYALLYAGLELEDSAAIVGRLDAMGVPYRLREDGATVLVPAGRALRLRMSLAEEGLPQGGSVGYEIFDQLSAFGTTNFLADVNLRRSLEGELGRTITALADVRAARVHLVLPKRELFRHERVEPSASVTLRMNAGRTLSRRQVLAIQHLTAAAVPGLGPERVTLVDDQGNLLARGGETEPDAFLPDQAQEYRAAYEARLKQTVEELLARALGAGHVRAEVHADIDFDRVTTTEELFDPESQVARSMQSVEEETQLAERDRNDAVTVGNNLPNLSADTEGAGRTNNENTTRTEETINYEISRTVRNHTQVGGRLRKLSIAVLVDGRSATNAAGELITAPLAAEEIARLEALVRSAVGFDQARGDVVELINMPFAATPAAELAESSWGVSAPALARVAELAALALVALMLIMLVVRPALRQLAAQPAPAAAGPGALAAGAAPPSALPAADAMPALPGTAGEGALSARVDIGQVDGRVRTDLIERATRAVQESPDDVVAIIRNWLHNA